LGALVGFAARSRCPSTPLGRLACRSGQARRDAVRSNRKKMRGLSDSQEIRWRDFLLRPRRCSEVLNSNVGAAACPAHVTEPSVVVAQSHELQQRTTVHHPGFDGRADCLRSLACRLNMASLAATPHVARSFSARLRVATPCIRCGSKSCSRRSRSIIDLPVTSECTYSCACNYFACRVVLTLYTTPPKARWLRTIG
jgi:hypothetical protein